MVDNERGVARGVPKQHVEFALIFENRGLHSSAHRVKFRATRVLPRAERAIHNLCIKLA